LTRLPHLKCIRFGSVRSIHLSFKVALGWLRAFKSSYIKAFRVNCNTQQCNIGGHGSELAFGRSPEGLPWATAVLV